MVRNGPIAASEECQEPAETFSLGAFLKTQPEHSDGGRIPNKLASVDHRADGSCLGALTDRWKLLRFPAHARKV